MKWQKSSTNAAPNAGAASRGISKRSDTAAICIAGLATLGVSFTRTVGAPAAAAWVTQPTASVPAAAITVLPAATLGHSLTFFLPSRARMLPDIRGLTDATIAGLEASGVWGRAAHVPACSAVKEHTLGRPAGASRRRQSHWTWLQGWEYRRAFWRAGEAFTPTSIAQIKARAEEERRRQEAAYDEKLRQPCRRSGLVAAATTTPH